MHLTRQRVSHDGGESGDDRQESIQIDARYISHGIEHVYEILRTNVARGAGGVGTTAESAQRSVEALNASLQRCDDIRKPHAASVVKMRADLQGRPARRCLRKQVFDLRRIRDARRIAEGDAGNAEIHQSVDQLENPGGIDSSFERTAERRRNRCVDGDETTGTRDDAFELRKRLRAIHVLRWRTSPG